MPVEKLTADLIKSYPLPAPGARGATRQVLVYDAHQRGLAVRITSGGSRVFVCEASQAGRTIRVRLGACSDLTLTEARLRAARARGKIADGANPNAEKRLARARSVTLAEAFEEYCTTRRAARRLAKRTEYDYRRLLYGSKDRDGDRRFNGYLSPWRDRALSTITDAMVARRYDELLERSPAQANYAMHLLSTVYNFARAKHRLSAASEAALGENPVRILSELKAWRRIPRRSNRVHAHQLEAWFAAVRGASSRSNYHFAPVVRDYLQFLILTGLRRNEAAQLRWADVDLEARIFTVRDTKNGTDHTLPLTDYLVELLEARQRAAAEASLAPAQACYVFPGGGKAGYLVEPKKMLEVIRKASGLRFTLHDLRRTFTSIAESIDIPAYALKRLLNHKMANDVTAGYIVTDVERLRAPMQRVTDFMLRAAGLRASAPVIEAPFGDDRKTGT